MNPAVKCALLSVARAGGLFSATRLISRGSLRILAYHGVVENGGTPDNFDGFQVSARIFRQQMEWAARYFRIVSLRHLLASETWPSAALAVTFDDGYANNARVAAPILRELGLPATFFVTTGFLDGTHRPWWYQVRAGVASKGLTGAEYRRAVVEKERRLKGMKSGERDAEVARFDAVRGAGLHPMMSWNEVRQLVAAGFEVGPHTVSHPNLGVEPDDVVESEVRTSCERVTTETGVAPLEFSYPYGRATDVSSVAAQTLRALGFRGAVTTSEGLNAPGADRFDLRRLNVTGNHCGPSFELLLSRLFAKS